jgi:hypothetical protein
MQMCVHAHVHGYGYMCVYMCTSVYVCMYAQGCVCVCVCVCRPEDSFQKLTLSLYHLDPRNPDQVVRLSRKYFDQLHNLAELQDGLSLSI